jgi:hypothetical protein
VVYLQVPVVSEAVDEVHSEEDFTVELLSKRMHKLAHTELFVIVVLIKHHFFNDLADSAVYAVLCNRNLQIGDVAAHEHTVEHV